MHRMFKVASSVRVATQIFGSPAVAPLARSSKFLSSLPVFSSVLQRELRAVIKINAEARKDIELVTLYHKSQGDNFFKRELKLGEREWFVITLVRERVYQKYGIRPLSVDDTWETIDIVTYPEKWIGNAVEKEGKSLEEALITVLKHLVPNRPCIGIEDLVSMVSMTPGVESEINKVTPDKSSEAGCSIKPK